MNAVPEFFDLGEEPMFGWLHSAAPDQDRNTVAVLCPPVGVDHICSYRAWRVLAERLAAAGFSVLRFDYVGTGNSAHDVDLPQQVLRWQRSVVRAVQHARARTGANQVALIGLRLGATLAASVAPDIPGVDSAVLWAPFRTGHQFVREETARARLNRPEAVHESGDVEATGFLMTRETIEELRGLDLLNLRERPASRVLLIERDNFTPDPKLVAHLTQLGCTVTVDQTPGTIDALATPMLTKVPEAIFDRLLSWLTEGIPESARGQPAAGPRNDGVAYGDGWREQPMLFGPDRRLFGILTQPESNQPPEAAVVFLNTGSGYHGGPHRMYVPWARAWARDGFASFRFDLGGIGDSRPTEGVPDNAAYPPQAIEEMAAAIAEVRKATQARRLVLFGLCAGGWHAFLAAREGLPVDGIIAVNPPLYLREGPGYKGMEVVEHRELERVSRSITNPEKWKRLLRGQTDVGAYLRLALTGAVRWLRARPAALGLPVDQDNLGSDLRAIATRKVPAQFVFSHDEESLPYFRLHGVSTIRRYGRILSWTMVDGADHTFEPIESQRALRDLLLSFLKQTGPLPRGGLVTSLGLPLLLPGVA
jgi:alpha-beta hydrolase superfamily lysophospholipase